MIRVVLYVLAYVAGVSLALYAAFTGSVGPEPPRTQVGMLLAGCYHPYFMLFCIPLNLVGFFIAVALSGIPFAGIVWMFIQRRSRTRQDDRAA